MLTAGPIIGVGVGAAVGALAGECLDWMPYFYHAIPEGIAYIGNVFTEGNVSKPAIESLIGNLDKVGAVAGAGSGGFLTAWIVSVGGCSTKVYNNINYNSDSLDSKK